jgi:hypothetical protein
MKKPGATAGLDRGWMGGGGADQAPRLLMRCARRDTFRDALFL